MKFFEAALYVFTAFGIFAQTAKSDTDLSEAFLGNYEIACENIVAARLKDQTDVIGPAQILPFNLDSCQKALRQRHVNPLLKPIIAPIKEVGDAADAVFSKTQADALKKAVKDFRFALQDVVELCRELSGLDKDSTVICFVGAPSPSSSSVFRGLFSAMLKNSLTSSGTVCTAEPITKSSVSTAEFGEMVQSKTETLRWPEVEQTLVNEGFSCSDDLCFRGLMAILPNPEFEESEISLPRDFLLIPRQMKIYRGAWKPASPFSICGLAGDRRCAAPELGTKNGICMSAEDGHTWGHTSILFNAIDDVLK
jgi:hypothetical protein